MRASRRSHQEARSRRERLLVKVYVRLPAVERKLQRPIPVWRQAKVRRCRGFKRAGARGKVAKRLISRLQTVLPLALKNKLRAKPLPAMGMAIQFVREI
jgi:hypothetical protein